MIYHCICRKNRKAKLSEEHGCDQHILIVVSYFSTTFSQFKNGFMLQSQYTSRLLSREGTSCSIFYQLKNGYSFLVTIRNICFFIKSQRYFRFVWSAVQTVFFSLWCEHYVFRRETGKYMNGLIWRLLRNNFTTKGTLIKQTNKSDQQLMAWGKYFILLRS